MHIDGGVDGYQYGPGFLNSEVKHQPLRPVLAKDGDFVPSFNSHIIGANAKA